jgi:hypothetical protein
VRHGYHLPVENDPSRSQEPGVAPGSLTYVAM